MSTWPCPSSQPMTCSQPSALRPPALSSSNTGISPSSPSVQKWPRWARSPGCSIAASLSAHSSSGSAVRDSRSSGPWPRSSAALRASRRVPSETSRGKKTVQFPARAGSVRSTPYRSSSGTRSAPRSSRRPKQTASSAATKSSGSAVASPSGARISKTDPLASKCGTRSASSNTGQSQTTGSAPLRASGRTQAGSCRNPVSYRRLPSIEAAWTASGPYSRRGRPSSTAKASASRRFQSPSGAVRGSGAATEPRGRDGSDVMSER
ncbi:Hypothetical protein SCLAV_p0646 (plasmid) [Streptomyces clavuligerus]|uniref:Uncharacterized protein n=1 Tax=Streptomyces clavuligerus TaxID=1901 RepID=D5SJP0_STRCL|nr:Hypothetical protein SCLAV_p0646 [Streptomyces clavuligerus]